MSRKEKEARKEISNTNKNQNHNNTNNNIGLEQRTDQTRLKNQAKKSPL